MKNLKPFCVLFFLSLIFFSCSNSITEAEKLDNQGVKALNNGDNEKALELFNQALEINPECWSAYNNRSVVYRTTGDFEKALADLNAAAELEGVELELVLANRADLKFDMNDITGSLVDYNKLISINNSNSSYYGNRADCNRLLGNLDQAFADYEKTFELDPTNYKALWRQGGIMIKKQNMDLALDLFDKALDIQEDADVYVARGIARGMLLDYPNSIADFNKAIELDSLNADAYYNRSLSRKLYNPDADYSVCYDLYIAANLGHPEAQNLFELNCARKYKFE